MNLPSWYWVGVGCTSAYAYRLLRHLWMAPLPELLVFVLAFVASLAWPLIAVVMAFYKVAAWSRGRRG